MPKPSLHTLIWSHQQQHYELHMHGQPEQYFRPGDESAFSRWLNEHTAFAFWGLAGRLSVSGDLMEQAAPHLWLSGEARTIQDWVLSLPDPALCLHTRLALENALRLIDSLPVASGILDARLVPQAHRTITRLEGLVHSTPSPLLSSAERILIERRVYLLRSLIEARAAFQRRDKARLQHLAREVEALPADAEVSWNMIPLNITYWLNKGSTPTLFVGCRSSASHAGWRKRSWKRHQRGQRRPFSPRRDGTPWTRRSMTRR